MESQEFDRWWQQITLPPVTAARTPTPEMLAEEGASFMAFASAATGRAPVPADGR